MDSTEYMPLDQPPHTKESQKRRLLIIAATTLALLVAISLLWQPQLPKGQECAAVMSMPKPQTSTHPQTSPQDITQRVFSETKIYSDLSPAADKNWTRLIPPNGGFVVRKNEQGKSEMAGVSMFHQLHCLSMIRMAVQDMRAGRSPPHNIEEEHHDKEGAAAGMSKAGHPAEEHWVHCLDYLVQAVLCSADGTIEPSHTDKRGHLVVDGYGISHQCANPDRLWAQVMGKMSRPGWLPELSDADDSIRER